MTRRSDSISASSRLRRPSVAASLTPSFNSGRTLHRRLSAIGTAEEGHDDAAAAAHDALHEEIDEIKRYETFAAGELRMVCTGNLLTTIPKLTSLGCPEWHRWSSLSPINYVLYILFSTLFAFTAARLVKAFAPYAAGSGISEIKCIIAGFVMKGFLGRWTLLIKSVCLPLAIGSGLSVGKEGPSVHYAVCTGNVISKLFDKYKRNAAKTREILSACAAAGVAVAFGSPIGGVLFSLETLWRSYFCALVATAVLAAMNPFRTGQLVMFSVSYDRTWHFFEVLFFIIIGGFGGLYGAFMIKWNLRAQAFRKKYLGKYQVLEATMLAMFTAIICYPNMFLRIDMTESMERLFMECEGGHDYDGLCEASNRWPLVFSLLVATIIRIFLVLISYGCKVPAGIFVPSMAIGASFGRMVGMLVQAMHESYPNSGFFAACEPDVPCITPGTYAFLGAAAALSGIMHITVSVVVIIAQQRLTNEQIVVGVTKAVSERFGKGGIADRMIWFNGFPFLDNKEEHSFGVSVSQVMTTQVTTLPAQGASIKYIEHILKDSSVQGFPIVESLETRILVGYIGCTELRYAVERARRNTFLPSHTTCMFIDPNQSTTDTDTLPGTRVGSPRPEASSTREDDDTDTEEQPVLDLSRFTNPTPLCVHPRLPLETVMELFKKLGPRVILVEYHGALTGLVTVKDCLKYQFTAEAAENMANVHRDEAGHEERLCLVCAWRPLAHRHVGMGRTAGCLQSQQGACKQDRKKEKNVQGIFKMLVNLHDGGLVAAAVAVVRRGEDGDDIPILAPVVALHDQLMCARDEREAVVVVEGLGNVLAKGVAGTSGRDAPAAAVVGVAPQQVTHGAFVGHFLYAVEGADVVEGVNAGAEAAVEAEDLVFNEGGEGQIVEEVGEALPYVCVAILAQALVVEAVDLGDLAGLVVAAQDGDALGVADLQGDEEGDCFDGEVAAVNVVAWLSQVKYKLSKLALSQSFCTSASDSCLQAIKLSIQLSRTGIEGASAGGTLSRPSGFPASSMLTSMLYCKGGDSGRRRVRSGPTMEPRKGDEARAQCCGVARAATSSPEQKATSGVQAWWGCWRCCGRVMMRRATFWRQRRSQRNMEFPDEIEEISNVPLQHQRTFGAGLKRKRINFVPEASPSDLKATRDDSAYISDMYLSIVLPREGGNSSAPPSTTARPAPTLPEQEISPPSEEEELCPVCKTALHQKGRSGPHEASLPHQLALKHSFPPSSLDRNRKGLTVMESYGWDPDSRLGLGAQSEGRLYPVSAKSREDNRGVGAVKQKQSDRSTATAKLDAGALKTKSRDDKRKEKKLHDLFYGKDEVNEYMGINI
ncbi:hypothetical protein FH972_024702 [Carpinus fangiana]|uniref:Chloride channel protein n=1 Tax=Carpinus fangiana TaxID=176857 RepID=A0A5N6KZ41_9ROSI|nr:hypothetical protein FH972_024702 [Carpinus fangiana]